jgi:hypothetical protein
MGILQVKIASTLQIVILIYTVIPLLKLVWPRSKQDLHARQAINAIWAIIVNLTVL